GEHHVIRVGAERVGHLPARRTHGPLRLDPLGVHGGRVPVHPRQGVHHALDHRRHQRRCSGVVQVNFAHGLHLPVLFQYTRCLVLPTRGAATVSGPGRGRKPGLPSTGTRERGAPSGRPSVRCGISPGLSAYLVNPRRMARTAAPTARLPVLRSEPISSPCWVRKLSSSCCSSASWRRSRASRATLEESWVSMRRCSSSNRVAMYSSLVPRSSCISRTAVCRSATSRRSASRSSRSRARAASRSWRRRL